MTEQDANLTKLRELIKDVRIAMLTHVAGSGRLHAHPMATQDVEFDGTVLFIAERDSQQVKEIQANPKVNIAYAGGSSWVSVSGTAAISQDPAKLKELWNTFVDAWMTGGPDNPNNVLITVDAETAEYWDTPGGKVMSLVNLVKSKVTGERVEGDNKELQL